MNNSLLKFLQPTNGQNGSARTTTVFFVLGIAGMAGVSWVILSIRAYEMAPWPWLFLYWACVCAIINFIPATFFYCWIRKTKIPSFQAKLATALYCILPSLIAEAHFLPEEIRFRVEVAEKINAQEENSFEHQRGKPFEDFYMMYDDEIGFWVMD